MDLEGKAALVTGAARRIGRAIALELARAGCHVAVHCNRSTDDAAETAREIERIGRRAVVLGADLSEPSAAADLPRRAADALGRLNVLINNASVFEPMTLDQFDPVAWDRTFAINLNAPMIVAHAARSFLAADRDGRIVNLTDISADRPWSRHLAYCVSKAGLACLTKALARAMAPDVRVNAVAPGAALFPEKYSEEQRSRITRRVPAMRAGTAEEVAAAVRFLVAEGDYVTGTILAVDGGRSLAWGD